MRHLLLPAAALLLMACPADPASEGDALVYLDRSSDTSTFFETTDVAVIGDVAYACTGVRSLSLHDVSDPESPKRLDRIEFGFSHNTFPRCSHVTFAGDRAVVSSHRDEVQPTPWVALLDVSDPASPALLDELGTDESIEQTAIRGDRVWVAAHDDGVLAFDVSGGTLEPDGAVGGLGNVSRVAALPSGVAAGTITGTLHLLDDGLDPSGSVELESAIQAIEPLGEDRIVVALGSAGLALIDPSGPTVLDQVDTNGTALRLDQVGEGRLLLANWSDLRVYRVVKDRLELLAVDAVFQAGDRPRHLAAGARGDVVVDGEWEGIHTLRYRADVQGPELTPSDLMVAVPADGEAHTVALELANEGQLPLQIERVRYPGMWSGATGEVTIEPGELHELELTFDGANSSEQGDLVIVSDDPDEPEAVVRLVAGGSGIGVGEEAPGFTYTGLNTGELHDLESQRGKVVLLSFFGVF
jgi:hypothetical protein